MMRGHGMYSLLQTLVVLIYLDNVLAYISYYTTRSTTKCFSVPGVPRLDFHECHKNEMILIQEAFHGISTNREHCYYSRGDCIQKTSADTDSKLNQQCIGLPSCSITVSVAWMTNCNAYSTYNHVIYQCIPKPDVLDICQRQDLTVSRIGFIRSSGYPNNYAKDVDCQCNVTTHRDQKILLNFADSDVEWSEGCKKDVVQIVDGESTMPRCGQLPRNYNITSETNSVQISFKTDGWIQHKGFWLTLEVLGSMDVSCGPKNWVPTTTTHATTTVTTIPPTTATTIGVQEGSGGEGTPVAGDGNGVSYLTPSIKYLTVPVGPASNDQRTQDKGSQQEISALVAIIIGILVLSIIVIVIVFLLLWFKKRHHKEEISKAPGESYFPRLHRLHRGGSDVGAPRPTHKGSPCPPVARGGSRAGARDVERGEHNEKAVDVPESMRTGYFTTKKSKKVKLKGKFGRG